MLSAGERAGEPERSGAGSPSAVTAMLLRHRVIVTLGTGGVGKTTVAAALALAARGLGRRTLCLTIDPARRLAQSLGLPNFSTDEVRVDDAFLGRPGLPAAGQLTVMMLDAGRTFDELIDTHAPNAEVRALVKSNRIYQHLSRHLAGTHAYMAMEKVQALLAEGRYDTIILDTPPSERALDFFDAPDRMREVVGSPLTKTLSRIGRSSGGKLGLRLVNAGVRGLLQRVGKITGASLLDEFGGLLSLLDGLFGGFAERAEDVGARLGSAEFGYVLVSSPQSDSVRAAETFARALSARGLSVGALVLNRTTPHPGPVPELEALREDETVRGLGLTDEDLPRLLAAVRFDAARANDEAEAIRSLGERLPRPLLVPDWSEPLHEPAGLWQLTDRLLGRA
ncbi:MAG TPA: ArsA-related P-loop ATPase [Polyangiaceae bacterium]|nr:ArsA-related P-loop ATPase [Polyangiaceae bacterium]